MATKTPAIAGKIWFRAGVAGMASYLDAAAIVSTGTALVLFKGPLGLTPMTIGLLSSLLTISIAVGSIVGGTLGDRFGRRRVFTATMILLVIGAAVMATASSEQLLYLGVVLLGLAAGADLPVSLALIAEIAPQGARGKLVAFSQVFWYLGLIAAQTMGLFVGGLGETGARLLYAHIVLMAVIVLLFRLRIPESRQWITARDDLKAHTGVTGKAPAAFRQLFKKPLFSSLIALTLFYSTFNIAANTKGQFGIYMYVTVAGTNVQTASAISLALLFVSIAFAILFIRLVDGPHRIRLFILGILFAALQFAIPATLGVTVWTLAFGYAFGTIGLAFAFEGILKVWTQESFPTLLRSTAQGTIVAVARVIAAVAALFTPGLLAVSPNALLAALSGLVIIAGGFGLWVSRLPKAGLAEADDPVVDEAAYSTPRK